MFSLSSVELVEEESGDEEEESVSNGGDKEPPEGSGGTHTTAVKTTEGSLNPHPRYYYTPIPQSATQTSIVPRPPKHYDITHRVVHPFIIGGGEGEIVAEAVSEGKRGVRMRTTVLIIMVVGVVVPILTIEWEHYRECMEWLVRMYTI